MRLIFAILLLALLLPSTGWVATWASDGTDSDVQAKIDSASDGDTVTIPAGAFTWGSQVTISNKGIILQGAGSGRVVARSASSVTVGTGTKTFTVNAGLSITNGQALTVERTGGEIVLGSPTGNRPRMSGTVTDYSGTTLEMNVTSVNSSGTHPLWIFWSPADTIITNNVDNLMLLVYEDTTHSSQITGLRIVHDTVAGDSECIQINVTSGGKPVLIHNNYMETSVGNNVTLIRSSSIRGVVWSNSFVAPVHTQTSQPIMIFAESANSWTTTSTMGTNDTTGDANFYIEDNDFHGMLNGMDLSENAKAVVRYNIFNNAGFGTHGADTGNYGVRHYEIYTNTWYFSGYSDGNTLPLDYWVFLRGGTGLIAGNDMTNMVSTDFGDKTEIRGIVENLRRNSGPNPCYGDDVAPIDYPCPRQIGMGRITGASTNDSITYVGDLEPLYVYSNGGGVLALNDYSPNDCSTTNTTIGYVVHGRDFYTNGTELANWVFSTYPNPYRAAVEGGESPATFNPVRSAGKFRGRGRRGL